MKSMEQEDFPIAGMRRLVAFDHSDWIRCLGNALMRAGSGKEGKYLISQSVDSRFVESRKSVRLSGPEIVRSAADDGRLLEFARNVREWVTTFGLGSHCRFTSLLPIQTSFTSWANR